MLLLTNGTIATMDPARPMAEAAVVDGAYFAYVGGRADAEDFARRFSRIVSGVITAAVRGRCTTMIRFKRLT